jgi:hypothetical protein
MMDDRFIDTMTEIEEDTWNAFKEIVKKFLGNIEDPLYKETVRNMLDEFRRLVLKDDPEDSFLSVTS